MKNPPGSAHPFAPPLKIVPAHDAPVIKRNAPVLSPFLCKWVVLENWLWRSATEPVEHEFIPARENVGAVITDAKRNIPYQRHSAVLRVRLNVSPLLIGNPLYVRKEVSASCDGCLFVVRETEHPVAGTLSALMLRWPSIPGGAVVIFLDENAEERVIG